MNSENNPNEVAQLKNQVEALEAQLKLLNKQEQSFSFDFKSLFENAHHPITIYTGDAIIVGINREGAKNLGLPQQEIIGRPLGDFVPEFQDVTVQRIKEAIASNEIHYYEDRVDLPDGTRWFWSVLQPIDDLGTVQVVSYDITRRKEAEEALKQREAFIQAIANTSPAIIYVYSLAENRNIYTNRTMQEWLGYSSEQIADFGTQVLPRIIHPDDLEEALEHHKEMAAINSDAISEVKYRVYAADGSIHWIQSFDTILSRNEAGEAEEIVGVGLDITERKKVEAELEEHRTHLQELVDKRTSKLKEAYDQLEKLSKVREEFVSNVSHELRSPIANIKLHHFLLQKSPENRDKYMDTIEREVERLSQTIEDLLYLTRLDKKRSELRLQAIELRKLVLRYVEDRTELASQQDIKLITELVSDVETPIIADSTLIGQVLEILLTNAMNYTPKGGEIHFATLVKHTQEQTWIGFSIQDSGPGIPPEEQPHIYDRFYRGKNARKYSIPGTGLGLAIAKEIVDRHSGTIEVESEGKPGKGTKFTVWLPTFHT